LRRAGRPDQWSGGPPLVFLPLAGNVVTSGLSWDDRCFDSRWLKNGGR
jgi:hypothetical protein